MFPNLKQWYSILVSIRIIWRAFYILSLYVCWGMWFVSTDAYVSQEMFRHQKTTLCIDPHIPFSNLVSLLFVAKNASLAGLLISWNSVISSFRLVFILGFWKSEPSRYTNPGPQTWMARPLTTEYSPKSRKLFETQIWTLGMYNFI